jgi:putative transposase
MGLSELREKHQADDAAFLVDDPPWLRATCHRHGLRFRCITHGARTAVKRVFREVKQRTNQFSNTFSRVEPGTAENRLQAFAFARNQRI